jgi:GNAT superfamily N-acetyltransferase
MDDALRDRLDDHVIAAQARLIQAVDKSEHKETPSYVRQFTGSRLPNFNLFIPLNSDGLSDEILADSAAYFKSRRVLYATAIDEHRVPDGVAFLNERRYQPLPPQPTLALSKLPSEPPPVQEVEVERVGTVASLTGLYTLLHQVFDFPLSETKRLFPVAQLKDDAVRHFLAFHDDQPVATGTAVCLGGIASIWNMCTLDNYRRRGFATALLHHMLYEAAENGCRHSMLFSTPMGYSLYDRMGFQIYSYRQWFLSPDVV